MFPGCFLFFCRCPDIVPWWKGGGGCLLQGEIGSRLHNPVQLLAPARGQAEIVHPRTRLQLEVAKVGHDQGIHHPGAGLAAQVQLHAPGGALRTNAWPQILGTCSVMRHEARCFS